MSYLCMIVDGAYPNDIRVRKEAEVLAENGHKVLVVCPKKRNDVREEVINNVLVYRIGNNYSNTKKGIYDIIESLTNVHVLFYFGLKKVFTKYPIQFLHVHDLPLAGTGFLFKNKVKSLCLDLHENYPEALKTWFLWKKSIFKKWKNAIFMNPKRWSKKEKKYCLQYHHIICVVDEMKEKLMVNFNIPSEKMRVVSNHEKKDFANNFNQKIVQNIIKEDVFSITYVGGFGPHRGLHTAIEAMPEIIKNIPHAKLFLVGKGSVDVENKLRQFAQKYTVEKQVEFVGYRPFAEVSKIMAESKINIIPHISNDHTDHTIPHKLFQIMMSKSLLLVSTCKPLQRIVFKYDAGVVFKAGNATDFAQKVTAIFNNYESYQQKSRNAYDAVLNKGENWETESIKLLHLYNKQLV